MNKGQVSVEALAAVILLLGMFVIVLITTAGWNLHSEILAQSYEEKNFCNRVSLLASKMYSSGPYSEILFDAELDFNVVNNQIYVGGTSCETIARMQNVEILQGTAKAKDLNGEVVFENV